MGSFRMTVKWTEEGEQKCYYCSRPAKTSAAAIKAETAELRKEHPKARDIVVTEDPYNQGYPYALDQLVDLILERRPDLSREEVMKHDYLILDTDRTDYFRGAYIVSLPEAKRIIEDEDSEYRDWVYMRDFGIVIFNVTEHTSHEIFLAHWYHILVHILPTKAQFERKLLRASIRDDGCESFLHANCGFYFSSAYGSSAAIKSTNMRLTPQEKTVFAKLRFRELEPE